MTYRFPGNDVPRLRAQAAAAGVAFVVLLAAFFITRPEPKKSAAELSRDELSAGLAAFSAADYSAARMHYRKAVMLDAKNAQAHYNLGFLRQTIDKNPAGAEPLYRAAIAADPDLAAAHFNLATVLMQTEPNSPEIDDEFAKAVDIDPSLSLRVPEREEAGPVGPASS